MIEDFTGQPFRFKFDETTTCQSKKQYDVYVQFWSLSKNIIVNRFSLFQLSTSTMLSIYFALLHSLNYGLSLWGLFTKSEFYKIELIQTNMKRMICRASKFNSCGKLYKKLNVLKLRDLFFMKIVNSMWDDDNDFLPTCFNKYFPHARTIHHCETRFSTSNKISKTRNYTSSRYGLNSFSNVAIDVSNKIKVFSRYTQVNKKSYEFEVERHSA